MNPLPSKIQLACYWCFQHNELVLSFPEAYLATLYQQRNPEGRIYSSPKSEQASNEVYLPRPDGLIRLHSSSQDQSYSLVLEFAKKGQAEDWYEKTLISSFCLFPESNMSSFSHSRESDTTRVYIKREIRKEILMPVPHIECLLLPLRVSERLIPAGTRSCCK